MDKRILREIGKTYRIVNTFDDFIFASSGLTKGQYQFLMRIYENPGINQKDISSLLCVDKTTTSKAISKLVAKGYALRKNDDQDNRNLRVYVTDHGKTKCEFISREEQFVNKLALKDFDINELEQFLSLLQKLNGALQPLYDTARSKPRDHFITLIEKEELSCH